MKIAPHELAFDIDGVLADSFAAFVHTAQQEYGIRVEYEDITEYDFLRVIDMDEATASKIIQRVLDFPVEMGIRAMAGAAEVLGRLSRLGPVLFVTARPDRGGIERWIQHELEGVNVEAIRLEATGNHQAKLPILEGHRIKYFVEDRLDTCYMLSDALITPIVFDQPWNRKPHPFQTVKCWDEISGMIEWNGRAVHPGLVGPQR